MQQPKSVHGVGNGSQMCNFEVTVPAATEDIDGRVFLDKFTAPCIEGSHIPGLLGIKQLKANDALIRCKTGEIWFLGPGGVEIKASPGSRHHQMREAPSGHWMLPINRFSKETRKSGLALHTGPLDITPSK